MRTSCPAKYLPRGALRGRNLHRCDIGIRYDDSITLTLCEGEDAAMQQLELVRIPNDGFIRYGPGIQGRGRWDGRNDILR